MARTRIPFPEGWLLLIDKYLKEKGQRCFTYRGLRTWLFRKPEYRDVEWHTTERNIRRLAELGFIDRIEKGRGHVIFCRNDKFEKAIRSVLESIYGKEMFR